MIDEEEIPPAPPATPETPPTPPAPLPPSGGIITPSGAQTLLTGATLTLATLYFTLA